MELSKEERFFYPIYPLLCLLAALSLTVFTSKLRGYFDSLSMSFPRLEMSGSRNCKLGKILSQAICCFALSLGVSRVLASHRNYGGPVVLH